ncbi:RdgB/HAM1 family non-canonical purine NTP pyrophosphatase [Sulfurospirillum sp. 1612]|uniref:RdgB/HAM1 family non-canonical purine NTP pyrophosphatase n=1 Tax=Sulfurospirillum sp. 1612 TaxID=3094835 RepID=UPI002F9485A4
MKIILATANQGKIKEFKSYLQGGQVYSYEEVLEPFEIIEDGTSFKENALIKAKAVYEKLSDKEAIVLADDSGISVDALGGEPGIYSARYAGDEANAAQNLDKLIKTLKEKNLSRTPAHYTAAIALVCDAGAFCVHGWMYGHVIDEKRGNHGFGYDPIFEPIGYDKTLGELDADVKAQFSHRSRALKHAKIILKTLKR